MKKRDVNVDLIRVLACLIVIGRHINNLTLTTLDHTKIMWGLLFSDGVAFFFILMGFFLFNNDSYIKVLKKTTKNILLPALIVLFLSQLFYPWFYEKQSIASCFVPANFHLKNFLTSILYGRTELSGATHLWYIHSYFLVVLLFPILKWICPGLKNKEANQKTRNIRYFLIGFALVNMLINDLHINIPYYVPITDFIPISVPIVYAITGYTIYKNIERIRRNRKMIILFGANALIFEGIRYALHYMQLQKDITSAYFLNWSTSFSFIVVASLIIVLLSIPIPTGRLSKVIHFVGNQTFYIYLTHFYIALLSQGNTYGRLTSFIVGYTSEAIANFTFLEECTYLLIRMIPVFFLSLLLSVILNKLKDGLQHQ
ncbi:MAG: acyltransferase [Firmicutes bacterium]|nr:acyltransferase [Bacillota bacterium]